MTEIRYSTHPSQLAGFDTGQLREQYLAEGLFQEGAARYLYSFDDRMVIGGIVPTGQPLRLTAPEELRAEYFLERREAGIVNVGRASGRVDAGGESFTLAPHECLYVGRGVRDVVFHGDGEAAFYLASATAHAAYPARHATLAAATPLRLGGAEGSNERTIYQYVHAGGIRSAQLVLGVTLLSPGSMWNTMPAHVHERRTEIYLYFGLDEQARVMHLMGQPEHTRTIAVADRQAVISPPWSIHCGFGTSAYGFVWAMAGENQDYADVTPVPPSVMR